MLTAARTAHASSSPNALIEQRARTREVVMMIAKQIMTTTAVMRVGTRVSESTERDSRKDAIINLWELEQNHGEENWSEQTL
jgi:hypothetical protein